MSVLCRKCGIVLAPDIQQQGSEYHVNCAPTPAESPFGSFSRAADPNGLSFLEMDVREALTEIIEWGARTDSRNAQVAAGPSELGTPCDRQLAYLIAGVKGSNFSDPWPSIVGKATHTWMQDTIVAFEKAHGLRRLQTEVKVHPDPVLGGHTDLWWPGKELVLDFKFPGAEGMRKLREEGFGQRYEVQLHLYGLGHERAGRKVSKVGIMALHRAGWLRDMWVKIVDYDRSVAEKAIRRMYDLGRRVDEEGILADPTRWSMIDPHPSKLCGYCPFYRNGGPADGTGCPGR